MDHPLLIKEQKTCRTCLVAKSVTEFGPRRSSRNGLHTFCRACARSYNNAYYDKKLSKHRPPGDRVAYMRKKNADHKTRLVSSKNLPCTDCLQRFPAPCMELDHVRGVKRHNVAEMSSWNVGTVLAEIQKCEVVCANCHRTRTAARRRPPSNRQASSPRPLWKVTKAERQREKIETFRSWLSDLKSAPCVDCHGKYTSVAMDFDHVLGEKLFSISNGWAHTRNEVMAELKKCELVCACCHRLRTVQRSLAAA